MRSTAVRRRRLPLNDAPSEPAAPRRPRVFRWTWVALLALSMILVSDYKVRKRAANSSVTGHPDLTTLVELAIYAIAGLFLVIQLGAPPRFRRTTPLLFAAWAWAVVMATSVVWAIYPAFAAARGVQLLVIAGLAQAITTHGRREHLHLFAHAYVVVVVLSVGLGLAVPFPSISRGVRFNWLYVHPVVAGTYLGLAVTVLVAYLARPRESRPRPSWPTWLYVTALVICVGGLLATRTRGAMGGAFVGVLVALMFGSRRPRRLDVALVTVLVIVLALLAYAPEIGAFLARGESAQRLTEFNGRTPLWTQAFQLFTHRPLVGYGLTASRGLFLGTIGLGGGHNAFINVLTDGGILGTGAWLGMIIGIFVAIRRLWWHPSARTDLPMLFAVMMFLIVNSVTVEELGTAANVSNVWCYVIVGWLGMLATQVRRTTAEQRALLPRRRSRPSTAV